MGNKFKYLALAFVMLVFTFSLNWNSEVDSIINCETNDTESIKNHRILSEWSPSIEIPLVTVVCSGAVTKMDAQPLEEIYVELSRQKEQIRVMLGTLLYFSHSVKWRVYIVTDTQTTYDTVTEGLETAWPSSQFERLQIQRRSVKMPSEPHVQRLSKQYRPCAWQKLFLGLIFPEFDSVVFTDSDVLFTGPAEGLWLEFGKFNETQAIGATQEPWYVVDKRQFAGKMGVNTGVLALNLTRLKGVPKGSLGGAIVKELDEYEDRRKPRHDQDMVNVFLKKYPHFLYEMPYKWNFKATDCLTHSPICKICISDGVNIVHGSDAVFYRNIDHRYRILYDVMKRLTINLTTSPNDLLLYYQGAIEGLNSFVYPETVCSNFKAFLSMTSFSLRKMASLIYS